MSRATTLVRAWLLACITGALIAADGDGFTAIDDLWFLDQARGRNLPCRVHLPAPLPAGRMPVVLFSHGLGGSQWTYGYLAQAWAKAGFAVIQPSHPGSDYLLIHGSGPFDQVTNLRRARADPLTSQVRPGDLSFLLDRLDDLEGKIPGLTDRLDRDAIGVGGHSLGAWTALALAGLRVPGQRFADPRPRAFLALSPPGGALAPPDGAQPPREGADDQWADIDRSVLMMTGSADETPGWLADDEDAAWRMQAWVGLPRGGKFLIFLDEAHHFTFSAGGGRRRIDPLHLAAIIQATTGFWRRTLGRADPDDGWEAAVVKDLAGSRTERK